MITSNAQSRYNIHRLPLQFKRTPCNLGLRIIFANSGVTTRNPSEALRFFEFYSLSHMYCGRGYFVTEDGERHSIESGNAVLIAPGFVHYYGQLDDNQYSEDNICFDGPAADFLRRQGCIRSRIINLGPLRRLQPIIKLAESPSELHAFEAGVQLQQLLLTLSQYDDQWVAGERNDEQLRFQRLLEELDLSLQQWWTPQEMSDFSGISLARLRQLFRLRTGMLPKIYLDCRKVEQAKQLLLLHPELKLERIAARLGYDDSCHFSRRFKQLTGNSPSAFRAGHSIPPPEPDK